MLHEKRAYNSKPALEVLGKSCLGGSISTILTQPLEVVKTRLQIQPILRSHPNIGVLPTLRQLYSSSPSPLFRARVFWAGTVPSLWRCVPGIGVYFSILNCLKDSNLIKSGSPSTDAFLLGFCTRCLVGTALLPFTIVKVQAEAGLNAARRSTLRSLHLIYTRDNWRGLYRGLLPTLARDSPYSGVYLMFYYGFRDYILSETVTHRSSLPLTTSCCALSAALLATAVTQPADVLRISRQLTPISSTTPTYAQVLRTVVAVDGLAGLWRGFTLRLVRRACFACITWTMFDSIPKRRQPSNA